MNSVITDGSIKQYFMHFSGKYNSLVQKLAKKKTGKQHFSCLVILHFVYYLFIISFSKIYIFYWYKITVVLNNCRKVCIYLR